jgi:NADH-quinone oxidoreductase subunit H
VIVEVVIKSLFILLVVVAALAPVITWIERKQSAVMQDRIGANRADINGITVLGLLHPLADVLKLLSKEDVVPLGANRVMHLIAPLVAAAPAVIAYAVIPFGGVYTFGSHTISLVAANPDWGLLYIFAIGSIATYGTVMAGWSSNNNGRLPGGLRASALIISYDFTMGSRSWASSWCSRR